MNGAGSPPNLAERLLARIFGRDELAESILGDLREEHGVVAAERPAIVASAWYWSQAFSLSIRFAGRRVRDRATSATRPHIPPHRGDKEMQTLASEARLALRAMYKRPGLTFMVMITLALALGANAAIFAVIDALAIHPYPFKDIDRLAVLAESAPVDSYVQESVSPANFLDWKKQSDVFDTLVAYEWWDVNLMGRDEPERVQGFWVSADFFKTLGIQPARGRTFTRDEETFGRHRQAVLGDGLWKRRFAGDPNIVGRSILLDGTSYDVVGIAPAGFDFPSGTELWAPLAFDDKATIERKNRYLTVFGRLAAGKTLDDAKAQMAVIGDRLEQQYPDVNKDRDIRVLTFTRGMMDEGLQPVLIMWQASAGFVLLIACANIANLLLARGAERHREIAVRLAIGAGRGRIVRQLLIESGLLALAAVPLALGLAWVFVELIRINMPANIVRFLAGWKTMGVDLRLTGFTCLLALVTAMIFGVMPALQTSRLHLVESLKEGGRGGSPGAKRQLLRRGLVVAEIALVLPLLVASGVAAIAGYRFVNGPQGYDPDRLLIMRAVLPDSRYPDDGSRDRFVRAALDHLKTVAGVERVAAGNTLPALPSNSSRNIEIEGQPNVDPANPPQVDLRAVSPGYLDTLRIPLVKGRGLLESDRADTERVAVVSESMAQKFWPGADPIGRRLRIVDRDDSQWITVVGIAGDHIHQWFGRRNYPTMFRPYVQGPTSYIAIAVRTSGDPTLLTSQTRAAIKAIDPTQPMFDVMSMRQQLSDRTIGLQYITVVMAVFGGIALVLAIVGVYGVMAYLISQRTHEIGVRIALGASSADVLRLTIGQAWRLTAVGVAVGLLLSAALSRLIEAGLFGLVPTDARMLAGFAAVLVVAALVAGYVPARRATIIDPVIALREP